MILQLNHTQINLGLTDDLNSALNVDLIPVAIPVISTRLEQPIQAAFCPVNSQNKLQRILALLKPLVESMLENPQIDFVNTPTYWLLPELAIDDKSQLIEWASLFKANFSALFVHDKTQFFPFGSSAIVMAIKAAEDLLTTSALESGTVNKVCLIAVDSLYHDLDTLLVNNACLTSQQNEGLIPSEGAAVTFINSAEQGLNIVSSESARATSHQVSKSVESLFHSIARQLKGFPQDKKISQFYTPSNGLSQSTIPWMEAYQQLSGHVSPDTRLKQLPLLTGDLGCLTGLFHFLHIYHAYQDQVISGNTLQLEMSARLYQAVNLYSWAEKDAR